MFPQTPVTWQSEDNKMEVLENVELDMPWAEGPIVRRIDENMDYQSFDSELGNSLQLHT